MDTNDAEEINTKIRNIQSNSNYLNTTLHNEITLNHQMTHRFQIITDHINTEQVRIEEYVNKNANKIKHAEDMIRDLQHINQINYNIDLLTNHLKDITETITLAKLNIIHKNILKPIEIQKIYETINKQKISTISIEHLYEISKLQAYYNASNIILNIQIPILSPEEYNLYHLLLLPINKTKEIETKPFVMYNEQRIQYLTQICPKIEGIYLCEESQYQEVTNMSQCIGKLMKTEQGNCPLNDIGQTSNILQTAQNNILLINVPSTFIKPSCRNSSFTIKGTAWIRFKKRNVKINGILYEDTADEYWDQSYILQLPIVNITSNSTKDVLSLKKLRQQNFQHEEMILETRKTTINNQIFTCSAVALLGILIAITYIVARRKQIIKYIIQDLDIAPTTSLWPSLYSKGGGVTAATATSTNTTTPNQQPPQKPPRARN